MKFSKLRNVRTPQISTSYSAGMDMYVPEMDAGFIEAFYDKNSNNNVTIFNGEILLQPKSKCLIPLGIRVNFFSPISSALFAWNKGGLASKKAIVKLAEVIDQDYQGEIFASVYNLSDELFTIKSNEPILQLVHLPILAIHLVEVPDDDLWDFDTDRGEGCLGHTHEIS